MNIFGAIMDKIFHHPAAATAAPAPAAPPPASTPEAAPVPMPTPPAVAQAAPAQPVDLQAVLDKMAEEKGDAGNYDSSIVDLLKLLDLDSSLSARKQLADELDVHVGEAGSAEENMALHKAVMQKLAENGGKTPAGLS